MAIEHMRIFGSVGKARTAVSRLMPALFFDCDGVLADTERFGHLPAFNETFAQEGLPVRWSDVGVRREAVDRRREGAHGLAADG